LAQIEHALALRMIETFGVDTSALALDMTNFATYIDSTNTNAPIAVRGKAKQKRTDLRLVGLGLVVTRDGGIPLVAHAYPGNKPDVTQFPALIDRLHEQHTALTAARHHAQRTRDDGDRDDGDRVTVVFDAGQNSVANFAHLAATGLHYVGSVPPSDCPDLLAMPAAAREPVDGQRFPGLSAHNTRRIVYGTDRRVVLTHSGSRGSSVRRTTGYPPGGRVIWVICQWWSAARTSSPATSHWVLGVAWGSAISRRTAGTGPVGDGCIRLRNTPPVTCGPNCPAPPPAITHSYAGMSMERPSRSIMVSSSVATTPTTISSLNCAMVMGFGVISGLVPQGLPSSTMPVVGS
jgi:hypothetical protein